MGETRVDLLHRLEDLADAYPAMPDESQSAAEAPLPDENGSATSPQTEERPETSEAPHGAALELPARRGRRRPTRLGLSIQFEAREGDSELGRLVETTVWVNSAHPAYHRAVVSGAEAYHLALTVAMALARVAVEPAQEHEFVATFLQRWGESASDRTSRRRS